MLCVGTLCSCGADVADVLGDYKIEKNIYYAALVDTMYNPGDGYSIAENDGKVVLSRTYHSIDGAEVSEELGELEKFSLKKGNFDELIFGNAWKDGASAENVRKGNKAAWKTEKNAEETVYVLLQKDESLLVASIKTKEGFTSCAYIRKIAK